MPDENTEPHNAVNFMDPKLARGIARAMGRDLDKFGDQARQQSFIFALELMRRNRDGQKLTGPVFNVMLSRILHAARDNPATLRIESERMRLSRNGMYHRESLQGEEIRHFTGDGEFLSKEWSVAFDHLKIVKGNHSGRFWKTPVLFDQHILERYLHRSGLQERTGMSTMADSGLPLAVLYRACALVKRGETYDSLEIALPAPGGVLCGGTEVVESKSLNDPVFVGFKDNAWGIHTEPTRCSLHLASSIRTYMDDAILDSPQRVVVGELRNWAAQHEMYMRQDPLVTFGWTGEGTQSLQSKLVEKFRPLCNRVQENFSGWRRSLQDRGYGKINWNEVEKRYATQSLQEVDQSHLAAQMGFYPKPKY